MQNAKCVKMLSRLLLKYKYYMFVFFCPIICFLIAGYFSNVYPFGDRSLMIIDGVQQYVSFYEELLYKVKTGQGLFYSMNGGLGYNFYTLFSYYLASPLSILVLLFPSSMINEAVTLIMLIKVGLCGVTFYYYVSRKQEAEPIKCLIFALSYALSGFIIGYHSNLMWLDCLYLLPIIVLGLERLVEKEDGRLYIVSLFMAIVSNYYIAFMICLFLVFYYGILMISHENKNTSVRILIKNVVNRTLHFAVYSVLAGGLAAIFIVPSYLAIKESAASATVFNNGVSFLGNYLDLIARQFLTAPPIKTSGALGNANLYCGVFSLVLVPLYLFDRKIAIRERIGKMALTLFLFFSMNVNVLTYIWHGFHMPVGFPNRFSFLYIFLILCMGFDVVNHLKEYSIKIFFINILFFSGLVFVCYYFSNSRLENYAYILTAAMILLYNLILIKISRGMLHIFRKKITEKVWLFLLLIICILELGNSAIIGLIKEDTVCRDQYTQKYAEINEIQKNIDDKQFYRMDVTGISTFNQPGRYNLPGVSYFSSTIQKSIIDCFEKLGMKTAINKVVFQNYTDFTNMIMGVKYIVSSVKESELEGFSYVTTVRNSSCYKNPYALPLGYMVNSDILDWKNSEFSGFMNQNGFLKAATGLDGLYKKIETDHTVSRKESTQHVALIFTVPESGRVYVDFHNNVVKNVKITSTGFVNRNGDYDNTFTGINNKSVYNIGEYNAGSVVSISYDTDDIAALNYGEVYLGNDEILKKAYEAMFSSPLQLTYKSDNHLKGNVTIEKDGVLFLSIPYDKGWSAKVDGKTASIEKIGGGFSGIQLEKGKHTIELNFVPYGFTIGAFISLLFFIAICIIWRTNSKKRIENNDMNDLYGEAEAADLAACSQTAVTCEMEQTQKGDL